MAGVPPAGIHKIEVAGKDGTTSIAELELRFARVRVLPPIGKKKRYPALDLTILHAREIHGKRGHRALLARMLCG